MSRRWLVAAFVVSLAVAGATFSLTRDDRLPPRAAAGGADSFLGVLSHEATTRVQGGVAAGQHVIMRLANVCAADRPVALVGVELREPEEDLRVTDVVVTVDEDTTGSRPPGRRLSATRIVKKEAAADDVVSHGCRDVTGRSHQVLVELVLDRRARVVADAYRYLYESPPGGELRRTDWIEDGYGLDTRTTGTRPGERRR